MKSQQKCTSIDHEKIEATSYCKECKVFMCNKCENFHSKLLKSHHSYNLDKEINEIFTGFCKEKNHIDKLDYFCKTHNQLCCAACLSKIKTKGNGQHTDCEVCDIEEIVDEKRNGLKKNIEKLEILSNNLQKSIDELKKIFEKINENKEQLKLKVQKIFTKIRNSLNNREEELLLEIDNKFNDLYFNEDILKETEKLPNKIQISLKNGKIISNEWNDENKIYSLINDCLNIENNIQEINIINKKIEKYNNSTNLIMNFYPKEDIELNNYLEIINTFGEISYNLFEFKKCPLNINENRKYEISGEKQNIFLKTGKDELMICGLCKNILEKNKEYKWKIKILKTKNYIGLNIGIAPFNFDINLSQPYKYGWFYNCYEGSLYSGPPHNYNGKNMNLKAKKDEIIVVMNMNKGTLKFIIDNEDKGYSYTNIPIDNPLVPAVTLYNKDDLVEMIGL